MRTEAQFPPHISADRPVQRPEDDLFGYAPFSKHLAESICGLRAPDGLVIAVHGPWGSGKTTLLNFVLHYVKQRPERDQPIIVTFNPWWFAGEESLARAFLAQLRAVLPDKLKNLKKLGRLIGDFSDSIAGAAELAGYGAIGKVLKPLKGKPKDVPAQKKEIADALDQAGKRIVIVIDDIDRLAAEEVRQLFKVVKAIADFPNVVYVLAFDKSAAAKALEDVSGASGAEYLEKIVQAPFELPMVDKTSLRSALFKQLDQVLEGTPTSRFDETYWGNVYFDGLDFLINVPRDVVRLVNALRVTYPAVRGEVNPVDFIALEAIRIFIPELYTTIRSNPEEFVGHVESSSTEERQASRPFHERWLERVPAELKENIGRMMRRVFPKLEAVFENATYGAEWEGKWRRDLRLCSADIFPTYLRLAVPEGSVSNQEMEALIAKGADGEALAAALLTAAQAVRPDGTSKARALLDRIADYVEKDITLEDIHVWVEVLFKVGDQLLLEGDENRAFFDPGNELRIARLAYHLLKRLDESSQYQALKNGVTHGDALRVETYLLGGYEEQLEKKEAGTRADALTTEHLRDLKELLLSRIRVAAQSEQFLGRPGLAQILLQWERWGTPKEVAGWVMKATLEDRGLVALIAKFTQKSRTHSVGDRVSRAHLRVNPKWLEPFLDVDATARRLEAIRRRGELSEANRDVVDQFLREYGLLKGGKNPDLPSLEGD